MNPSWSIICYIIERCFLRFNKKSKNLIKERNIKGEDEKFIINVVFKDFVISKIRYGSFYLCVTHKDICEYSIYTICYYILKVNNIQKKTLLVG